MSNFYTNVAYRGDTVLFRGYHDGRRITKKIPFKPYLFHQTQEESKYRTIHGDTVKKVHYENSWAVKEFLDNYNDVSGLDFYGMDRFEYVYLYEKYNRCEYDPSKIKECVIDIEVSTKTGYPNIRTANNPITAITMQYKDIIFVFGFGEFVTDDPKVKYIRCKTEKELLAKFLKIWSSPLYMPDVVSGYNINGFDIPYIVQRITNIHDSKAAAQLSPWGRVKPKIIYGMGGREELIYNIEGIAILDYMELYKKFVAPFKPQESYSLNHISWVELGQEKLDYSEYGGLQELFEQNHQKFIDYNILDCDLVFRLNKKLNLFGLIYHIAYRMGVNYQDALKTVVPWDVAIHNHLMDKCVVVPAKATQEPVRQLPGGYVKPAASGMHDWVVSFDLTSLYPHLIMHYNIGPDVHRGMLEQAIDIDNIIDHGTGEVKDFLQKENLSLTASGNLYSRDKRSFLSELMKTLFDERKAFKDQMKVLKKEKEKTGNHDLDYEIAKLDTYQHAIKILLNSAYGALGNAWFRWHDIRHAESITLSGQLTTKWAAKKVNLFLNKLLQTEEHDYIITADTDSIYIDMSKFVEKCNTTDKKTLCALLDTFCEKKVQPYLDKIFDELMVEMNSYEQAMFMKREAIADRGVFTTKKRYMLNVLNNEGVQYNEPELKIVGIESVRSSTPAVCKDAIKEAVRLILQEDEDALHQHVKEFRDRFFTYSFEEIAFPRSVNGLSKYFDRSSIYKKATPIAVRGALLYNHYLYVHGAEKKYSPIMEGEKIKFCYLRMPNPIQEDVISIPGKLPREFDLHNFIDYNLQFEKAFLAPVENICSYIGWSTVKINRFKFKKKEFNETTKST